jgi:hypothetical protein
VKAGPTLDGSLRIDAEDAGDWAILRCIEIDARGRSSDLATKLGERVRDEPEPGDWEELVVPELRAQFDVQVELVARMIGDAEQSAEEEEGSVIIGPAEGELWYGALNQARLAIEDRHRFSEASDEVPERDDPARRSAYFRAQFYLALQELLLQFVLDR